MSIQKFTIVKSVVFLLSREAKPNIVPLTSTIEVKQVEAKGKVKYLVTSHCGSRVETSTFEATELNNHAKLPFIFNEGGHLHSIMPKEQFDEFIAAFHEEFGEK